MEIVPPPDQPTPLAARFAGVRLAEIEAVIDREPADSQHPLVRAAAHLTGTWLQHQLVELCRLQDRLHQHAGNAMDQYAIGMANALMIEILTSGLETLRRDAPGTPLADIVWH